MRIMTKHQRQLIAELERAAHKDGLEHHLAAAQSLARDGLDVETIEGMMRGMYSRTQIRAMIVQARETDTTAVVLDR